MGGAVREFVLDESLRGAGSRRERQPRVAGEPRPLAVRRSRRHTAAASVLLVALVLTGVLVWATSQAHASNEHRLLLLELHQAAAVVTEAAPAQELPLARAADAVAGAGGDSATFRREVDPLVGTHRQFVSASLWHLQGTTARQVDAVGVPPTLTDPAAAATFFSTSRRTGFGVTGHLQEPHRRLGYAALAGSPPTWAVYAEVALPGRPYARASTRSPFDVLNYALYLGKVPRPSRLIATSITQLPPVGDSSTLVAPFGDTFITIVGSRRVELGGSLLAQLPWITAILGAAMGLVAAATADLLSRRREMAVRLAHSNEQLFEEQRGIAQVLQRALLPAAVPLMRGLTVATRYVASSDAVEVGGDWYDVIRLDDRRLFFAMGDVSGRGVASATVMARLHFAVKAYVAEGHGPSAVVNQLENLLSLDEEGFFATVVCGLIDIPSHRMTIVNAGHPDPILLDHGGARLLQLPKLPPVGMFGDTTYLANDVTVPSRSTLVLYTDGLVERRGESINVGLERLRAQLESGPTASAASIVSSVMSELLKGHRHDDAALLVVQWQI